MGTKNGDPIATSRLLLPRNAGSLNGLRNRAGVSFEGLIEEYFVTRSEAASVTVERKTGSTDSSVGIRVTKSGPTCVVRELLLDLARLDVPDDGRLVHAPAQQVVALLVPLEREDGAAVLAQRLLQLACAATRNAVNAKKSTQKMTEVPPSYANLRRGCRDAGGRRCKHLNDRLVTF